MTEEEHHPLHCEKCGFPVAYCQFHSSAKQKEFGCYSWLKKTHPDVFAAIYPEQAAEAKEDEQVPDAEKPDQVECKEENNAESSGDDSGEEDSESSMPEQTIQERQRRIPKN